MPEEFDSTIQTASSQLMLLAESALQIALVIVVARLATGLIRRIVWRRIDIQNVPATTYVLVNNGVTVVVIIVALTILLAIWGATWASLLAALSVSTLAIVLGLQDLLKSVLGGAFIILERPFEVGDRIKVRDISGEVADMRLRTTVLRNDEGVRVAVPNSIILTDPLTNYDEPLAAAGLIMVHHLKGDPSEVRANIERVLAQDPALDHSVRITVESQRQWRPLIHVADGFSRTRRGPVPTGTGPLRVRIVLLEEDPARVSEREIVRRLKALYPAAEVELRRGSRA